jgi:hypothetical protein
MSRVAIDFDRSTKQWVERTLARCQGADLYAAIDRLFVVLAKRGADYTRRTQLNNLNLRRRTGNLFKDVEGRAERHNGVPAIRVGIFEGHQSLKYAGVQEYGTQGINPSSPYATIRPVNGRALAMPVGWALDARGVARYAGPRSWPRPLQFVPILRGNVIGLLQDKTMRGTPPFAPDMDMPDVRTVYLLLRKSDIPPHWFLRKGMHEFMPRIINALAELLKDRLNGK